MKGYKPDYAKIIFVGIPIGFLFWVATILLIGLLANKTGILEYWFPLSIFFTTIFMVIYFVVCIKYSIKINAAIISDPDLLKKDTEEYICDFCSNIIEDKDSAYIWVEQKSGKHKICCPACRKKKSKLSHIFRIFSNIIVLIFGIVLLNLNPDIPIGYILINSFLFVFFDMLNIIPHELGHAIASKLLGEHVACVIIGRGKLVYDKKWWNIIWYFHKWPIYGLAIWTPSEKRHFRKKNFLIVLSGPAVNITMGLILLYIFPIHDLLFNAFSAQVAPFSVFFLANALVILSNLFPHQVKTDFGKVHSDGLQLLITPFLSQNMIEQRIAESQKWLLQFNDQANLAHNKTRSEALR